MVLDIKRWYGSIQSLLFFSNFLFFSSFLYHFTGEEITHYFYCSCFSQETGESMSCPSCRDEIVDKENLLAFYFLEEGRMERIFLSDRGPLCFGATRLVRWKYFFLKRAKNWCISWSEILDKEFRMIGSSKNPIPEAHRWIDYTVGGVEMFSLHGAEKLAKVDIIDMIVDKFESMNSAPHFFSIQFTDDDLF
jgi:hypothetical protein